MENSKTTRALKWIAPIFLVSLVYILDPRYFTSPPLRSDDWDWLVHSYVFNPLKVVNLADRRPFISTPLALLTPIFGLNIQWYYVVNWLVIFACGLVFYQIVKRVFPHYAWLALPSALIFLIYPVNYARTWLIVINNSLALLLALIVILLMQMYAQSGKAWPLLVGNVLFLISLGMYEIGFGIVMLAALLFCCFGRELPKRRRILIGTFLLTGIGFFVWRTFIQPNILEIQDFYLDSVNLSVSILFERYVQGAFIFLFNWVGPLLFGFGDRKYWVFVGIGAVLLIGLLATLPRILKSAKSDKDFIYTERMGQSKALLKIALVGLLFWVAGYIPIIALWQPIFYGDGSRVNLAAVPGAALALTAGLAAVITLISKKRVSIQRILVIVLIPLIILGAVYQVRSQNERVRVWEINKEFWHLMFETVPGLESGAKVVIVIPGYADLAPFEMLPMRGDWEAQSALNVLYNDPSLFAEYYYLDIPDHPDNWFPTGTDFSAYVFVYFDPENDSVRVIEDPASALALSVAVEGYDPEQRITTYRPGMEAYRGLVD